MDSYISRNYLQSQFGDNPPVDSKIELFRDRVQGWQIDIAEEAIKIGHSGYAVISILFSYFEMIEQYARGESSECRSKEFFVEGFKKVFPDSDLTEDQIKGIYSRVRCGMYHSGYTKMNTLLSGTYNKSISFDEDILQVNPHILVTDIKNHFISFIQTLRNQNNQQERENFKEMFDKGLEK